jgi:hypothetical protein
VPDIKFQKTKVVVAGSRYRVGGVGLGYGLDIRGNMVGFPATKRHLSLFELFQIECGPIQPSMGVKGFFPGVSGLGLETNHLHFLGRGLRTDVAIGTVPHAFMACTSNKFTCKQLLISCSFISLKPKYIAPK